MFAHVQPHALLHISFSLAGTVALWFHCLTWKSVFTQKCETNKLIYLAIILQFLNDVLIWFELICKSVDNISFHVYIHVLCVQHIIRPHLSYIYVLFTLLLSFFLELAAVLKAVEQITSARSDVGRYSSSKKVIEYSSALLLYTFATQKNHIFVYHRILLKALSSGRTMRLEWVLRFLVRIWYSSLENGSYFF